MQDPNNKVREEEETPISPAMPEEKDISPFDPEDEDEEDE